MLSDRALVALPARARQLAEPGSSFLSLTFATGGRVTHRRWQNVAVGAPTDAGVGSRWHTAAAAQPRWASSVWLSASAAAIRLFTAMELKTKARGPAKVERFQICFQHDHCQHASL